MRRASVLGVFITLFSSSAIVSAQTYHVLRTFESLGCTSSSILRDQDGYLYATTACGGESNNGAIVKMTPSGRIAILYSFSGGEGGSNPEGDLIRDAAGNVYGTTYQGGASSVGTVYKVAADGTYSLLHSFDYSADGGFPLGALIRDHSGNLYGITGSGGPSEEGTVFKVTPGGAFSVLHAFSFTDGQGYLPSSLTSGRNGYLYGTTSSGGPLGGGTVFKLAPDGTFTLQFSFAGDSNGATPFGLMHVTGGDFVGLTSSGGANLKGTVFRLTANGTFTLLHTFTDYPGGGLAQDGAGNLYGVAPQGGTAVVGSVYRLASDGTFDELYSFTGGSDGSFPHSRPLLDGGGAIFGPTSNGGVGGWGVFFTLAQGGSLTVIHPLRLSYVNGGLALDARGSLFGTTQRGGSNGSGSAFELSTIDGAYTEIHSFGGVDGDFPVAGLALDGTGQLYGTTSYGGMFGGGTAFRLGIDRSFTVLHDFGSPKPPSDGSTPLGGLIRDDGGNLYGTTQSGGGVFQGTLFTLTSDGASYAILHDFGSTGDDGFAPLAAVTLDGLGNLYGAASQGGIGGAGIVFKRGQDRSYSVLHAFEGTDGAFPAGAPALDSSGYLYGTASQGGASNLGNMFKVAPDGTFTVLHDFNGADGASPLGSLVLDSGGNAYGTTTSGGSSNRGTVFRLAADGSHTVLHSFHGLDGSFPLGGLTLDGNVLYGTASAGGRLAGGVVFRLELP